MTDTMRLMAEYIAVGQKGDRQAARTGLTALWEGSLDADPVTKCGLAHSLADVQDSAKAELEWDLRALISALNSSNSDFDNLGMTAGTAGLMPSLHLNLADVYRRLGQREVSRGHAQQALHALGVVATNPYFDAIAEAAQRVLDRLANE